MHCRTLLSPWNPRAHFLWFDVTLINIISIMAQWIFTNWLQSVIVVYLHFLLCVTGKKMIDYCFNVLLTLSLLSFSTLYKKNDAEICPMGTYKYQLSDRTSKTLFWPKLVIQNPSHVDPATYLWIKNSASTPSLVRAGFI